MHAFIPVTNRRNANLLPLKFQYNRRVRETNAYGTVSSAIICISFIGIIEERGHRPVTL